MQDTKNYSDEMLKKYVSSTIEIIKKKRQDPSAWKKNEEFHSQIVVRREGDENVSNISNGEI